MPDKVVLGVHSRVDPNTVGSFDQFVDGHAWISVNRNGVIEHYGLWPDEHPKVVDNGPATDIRIGMESHLTPTASRYYGLSPDQVTKLDSALKENVTWGYTNTCASWASETVNKVTGKRLDASELLITDTPRELIESIRAAERREPSSPAQPLPPPDPKEKGSSLRPLGDASRQLHQQATAAVHRLDAAMGRTPDESSDRMSASLANLARSSGLERIDHVVLSVGNAQSPPGQNVFVVQGRLDDPGHLRAHMSTDIAVQTPVSESLQELQTLDRQLTESRVQPEPTQARQESHHRVIG